MGSVLETNKFLSQFFDRKAILNLHHDNKQGIKPLNSIIFDVSNIEVSNIHLMSQTFNFTISLC